MTSAKGDGANRELIARLERVETQNKKILEMITEKDEPEKVYTHRLAWLSKGIDNTFTRLFSAETLAIIAIFGMGLNMLSIGIASIQMAAYGIAVNNWIMTTWLYMGAGCVFIIIGVTGAFWLSRNKKKKK